MASALTETSVFDAVVIATDDGDTRNANSVRTTFTQIANRAKWLKDNKADSTSGTLTNATITNATFTGTAQINTGVLNDANGGFRACNAITLANADATIFAAANDLSVASFRIPQLTANRIYTFSGANTPQSGWRKRIRIVRPRSGDAFTATIKRSGGTTICVFSASASGWVEFEWFGAPDWGITAWAGGVTSLDETV